MKNNTKISLIGILIISLLMIRASVSDLTYNWMYTFDGKPGDNYQAVLENSLGEYVAFGQTNNFRYKGEDVLITKWEKSGRVLLDKNVGGLEDEFVKDAQIYKSGYVIVGYTKSANSQTPWLAFFDKQLNLVKDFSFDAYDQGVFNKLIINDDHIYLFGHNGKESLALKVNDQGEILATFDDPQKGEMVDAEWINNHLYILAKACIDCYTSKSVYSLLIKADAETLVKQQSEVLRKNQIEIAEQLEYVNDQLYAIGLFFDPKLNIQSSLVSYNLDNLQDEKFASYGKNWEDELLGIEPQSNGDLLLYGKSLSDAESRKRRETYRAWQFRVNKDLQVVGDEMFYGKGKYNVFNDAMMSIDGSLVVVGSSDDLPFLIDLGNTENQKIPTGQTKNKVFLLDDYFVEEATDGTLEITENFEYVFDIENRSDTKINKVKLDVKLEGLDGNEVEVPPYIVIPSLKPRKTTKAVIPITPKKLVDGTFEIIVELDGEILTKTEVRTKELKTVVVDLAPSIELISIDSSNFTAIAQLNLMWSNLGNKALDQAKITLSPSSNYNVIEASPPPESLNPAENFESNLILSLGDLDQDQLFFNLVITDDEGYEKLEQFSLDVQNINQTLDQYKEATELAKIKESRAANLTNLVRLSNISTNLEKTTDRKLPTDLPAIEAVTKIDIAKVFSNMSIHWEGVQGRDFVETKKEKASINVSIQNMDESIDSLRIIYNDQPLTLAKNHIRSSYQQEVFESEEGLGTFITSEILLIDGKNEFSCEFFVGEHSFVIDDKLNYQYEEEKGTLHLVSIGVPDLVGAEKDRLKYTTKDAEDFVGLFKSSNVKDDYKEIKEHVLNTEETTTQLAIMQFIRDFELQLESPKDLLVVYLSSHGFISQNNGELYISTSDYSHKSKEFSCINFQDVILLKLLDLSIPKVLFLDVCHSGAIINEAGDSEVSEESQKINTFLEQKVAADKQLYMVSSSNKGQYSYEFSKLENSAFIAAIKESINNEAYSACALGDIYPDANDDGVLKLTEMFQFVSLRVPCIVKTNRKNAAQNPMSKTVERDLKLFDYF